MPKRILEENQRRFAELLEASLAKSGRKRVELARACHWDASMVTKILKLQARPGLAIFLQFMAPFLIANGGMTHARQVIEMAELLSGELDETDLNTIVTAAERQPDSFQSRSYIRDRANTFRQTIVIALSDAASAKAISTELADRTGFGVPPARTIATEPATSEIESESPATEPDSVVVTPTQDWPRVLAEWRAVVREFPPMAHSDELEPDEVIAAVLEWESQLTDPALAGIMWNWLGVGKHQEQLRQRSRLELVLKRFNGNRTWNQLEWEWPDWVVAETARRNSGQAQLSPRQMTSFVADLGQIAFEAVKQNDGQTLPLTINLNDARPRLPVTQSATWDWLRHVAELGPVRLSVTDSVCQFVSRDEAEFLAAQYLLEVASDDDIQRMVKNAGRPFGVLRQMVRILHFTGKDESVRAIVEGLLAISDVIPLRYLDAAELLAACDAVDSKTLYPLWAQVEAFLCDSWVEVVDAPEYRTAIARVMGVMRSGRFLALLPHTVLAESQSELYRRSIINALAEMGGPRAIESLFTLADQGALREVLAGIGPLAAIDAAELLTRLALRADVIYAEQCAAVSALNELGSVPALRALQRLTTDAPHPKTCRYAESQLEFGNSPALMVLRAREIEQAAQTKDNPALLGLVMSAKGLLPRSAYLNPASPAPTLARALARIWIDPLHQESVRTEAAMGLIAAKAWPAFEIVLTGLPLADYGQHPRGTLAEHLCLAISSPPAKPLLQHALEKAASATQRDILTRCLESLDTPTAVEVVTHSEENADVELNQIEAAEVLKRRLRYELDPIEKLQALDALVAMNESGSFELLVDVAQSAREPEIQERASYHLAEAADFGSLLQLPTDLKPILYRAALLRDVRFQREMLRHKVILANGAWKWI